MIQIYVFKKKEMEGGEGRPQLGGLWMVLMIGGQWEEKEKHHFYLFSFSPQQIYLNLLFSLILSFYFTMVLDRYFMPFLYFP